MSEKTVLILSPLSKRQSSKINKIENSCSKVYIYYLNDLVKQFYEKFTENDAKKIIDGELNSIYDEISGDLENSFTLRKYINIISRFILRDYLIVERFITENRLGSDELIIFSSKAVGANFPLIGYVNEEISRGSTRLKGATLVKLLLSRRVIESSQVDLRFPDFLSISIFRNLATFAYEQIALFRHTVSNIGVYPFRSREIEKEGSSNYKRPRKAWLIRNEQQWTHVKLLHSDDDYLILIPQIRGRKAHLKALIHKVESEGVDHKKVLIPRVTVPIWILMFSPVVCFKYVLQQIICSASRVFSSKKNFNFKFLNPRLLECEGELLLYESFYHQSLTHIAKSYKLSSFISLSTHGKFSEIERSVASKFKLSYSAVQTVAMSNMLTYGFPFSDSFFADSHSSYKYLKEITHKGYGKLLYSGPPYRTIELIENYETDKLRVCFCTQPYDSETSINFIDSVLENSGVSCINFSVRKHPREDISFYKTHSVNVLDLTPSLQVKSDFFQAQDIIIARTSSILFEALSAGKIAIVLKQKSDRSLMISSYDVFDAHGLSVHNDAELFELLKMPRKDLFERGRACIEAVYGTQTIESLKDVIDVI
jgi:hypothetical protein